MTTLEAPIRDYMLKTFDNITIVSGEMALNIACLQGRVAQSFKKLGMAEIYYQAKSC